MQTAALLHGSGAAVPGSMPQKGTGARAAGALPGSDPAVFLLRYADTGMGAGPAG